MPVAQIWIDGEEVAEATYSFRDLEQTNQSMPGLGGRPSAQLPGSARFEYELQIERSQPPLSMQKGDRFLQVGERRYEFAIEDIAFEDEETGQGRYLIVTKQQLPESGVDPAGAVDLLPD